VVAPDVFGEVEGFVRSGQGLFAENLRAARKRGELGAGTKVEDLARFLVEFELGLLTYGILEPRRAARRRTLAFLDRVLG
jgi:hypothetical protein